MRTGTRRIGCAFHVERRCRLLLRDWRRLGTATYDLPGFRLRTGPSQGSSPSAETSQ